MVDVAIANMFGLPVGTFRWDSRYETVAVGQQPIRCQSTENLTTSPVRTY